MGFWDGLLKLAPAIATVGATVYGANLASDAADKAASQTTEASKRATAAQQESLRVAEENMRRQQAAASPGLIRMQQVVGRGDNLTPVQQAALDDARRTTLDALQGGSVRGSARATAEAVRDVDGRMTDQFIQTNRQQSDNAAQNLASQYFGAGNTMANIQTNQGTVASQGLMNAGNIAGANTMGQATIKGNAIGDISAVIADQMKQSANEKRASSYAPVGNNVYDENARAWRTM